jgi:hypothetical protein
MEQSSDIKSEIKRLRCLKQYNSLEDANLEKIAAKNVILRNLVADGNFINDEEKKKAKNLFSAFLSTHDFESTSDLNTLSMLTFQIVLVDRIQKALNDCTTKDGKSFISDKLTKSLSDATNQVLALKLKLHIDNEDKKDDLTVLQLLKKRFNAFIQSNKNEFTCVCAKCGNLMLLRRRVDNFDIMVHPMFSGRFWYSKHAIQMVKDGKMTKEDYASIFSTSTFYVDWCIENEGKIVSTNAN